MANKNTGLSDIDRNALLLEALIAALIAKGTLTEADVRAQYNGDKDGLLSRQASRHEARRASA